MSDSSALKKQAALKAIEAIQDGMIVGLGTGSTAAYAIEALGARVAAGLKITGIATSVKSAELARRAGIKLVELDEAHKAIDVTIDGADEVEHGSLNLIKGLGGALLHEKITAAASRKVIIIVDDSKVTQALGSRAPVPVEVEIFGWITTAQRLARLIDACAGVVPPVVHSDDTAHEINSSMAVRTDEQVHAADNRTVLRRRQDGSPFVTDSGNFIIDCHLGVINDAPHMESLLSGTIGVVETGLFLNIASQVVVASAAGVCVLGDT